MNATTRGAKANSLFVLVVVATGMVLGSFLTVVINRFLNDDSVVPLGRCDSCGFGRRPHNRLPVLRWVAWRDRCCRCGNPIGVRMIVIELVTAGLFVLMAVRFDHNRLVVPAYCILMAVLFAQTWIDLNTHRLPRQVTYWGIGLGACTLGIAAIVTGEPERIWMMAFGAVIAFVAMWFIYQLSNGGMGDGDVRFAPLLGLYLGWLNPGIVLPGLFFGFIAGAVVGVAIMAVTGADRRTAVPFGPFLALGTVVAIFAGQHFVDLVLALTAGPVTQSPQVSCPGVETRSLQRRGSGGESCGSLKT